MARMVSCKKCKSKNSSDMMFKIPINIECTRFEYYCNELEYEEFKAELEKKKLEKETKKLEKQLLAEKKRIETDKYNDLMTYVLEDLLEYEKGMTFPTFLVKEVRELSKFYDYVLIKQAFYKNSDTIKWVMKTKTDWKEFNKMAYIMKVVKGNINDIYLEDKASQKVRERIEQEMQSREAKIEAEAYNDFVEEVRYVKKETKSIQSFLDEEDLF